MEIIIDNIMTPSGKEQLRILADILEGSLLFHESYRFREREKLCSFLVRRDCLEKPVRTEKGLFFKKVVYGSVNSVIEIAPVVKVFEEVAGMKDFEFDFDSNRNILMIGTFEHMFHLYVLPESKIRLYDSDEMTTNLGEKKISRTEWERLIQQINRLKSA